MFRDFRPVLSILLRFVGIYVALILLYQLYLNMQTGLDGLSTWVARQVCVVLNLSGYETKLQPQPRWETTYFVVRNQIPSRMVEGCNAVSIMILFVAFVFAFYKGSKTVIFSLIGLLIIHIMNVLRIAGLNIFFFVKPAYFHIGHEYLFPAIIYGTVVALWLIWIKFFALKR